MDTKKILILLIALTIYINYENYIKEDTDKLYRQINSLENKIKKEEDLITNRSKYADITKGIKLEDEFFEGKKLTYSKAMGELQNSINDSAKTFCKVKKIKWAQISRSENWYEYLRMDVSIECKADEFMKFVNELRERKKLIKINALKIQKDKKEDILNITFQITGFRNK